MQIYKCLRLWSYEIKTHSNITLSYSYKWNGSLFPVCRLIYLWFNEVTCLIWISQCVHHNYDIFYRDDGKIPRVKTAQEYFDLIFYYKTKQLIKKEHNKHSKIERFSCINFTSYKQHLYFNNVFVCLSHPVLI